MTGNFVKISFLTFGTSPKKNSAKMPADTPKPAAMVPYRIALGTLMPQKLGRCVVLDTSISMRDRSESLFRDGKLTSDHRVTYMSRM